MGNDALPIHSWHPKFVRTFSRVLSQRTGRLTPLLALCPGLQRLNLCGGDLPSFVGEFEASVALGRNRWGVRVVLRSSSLVLLNAGRSGYVGVNVLSRASPCGLSKPVDGLGDRLQPGPNCPLRSFQASDIGATATATSQQPQGSELKVWLRSVAVRLGCNFFVVHATGLSSTKARCELRRIEH